MKAISLKLDLEPAVARLNRLTDSPLESYSFMPAIGDACSYYAANIGNYHLDQAYGGVALYRMVGPAGGCTDVLGSGHVTKRDLYQRLHAYIRGIEAGAAGALAEAANETLELSKC